MPPDIGQNLVIQATRRFTCNPAGYRTVSPIRSTLMVNSDGYVRLMLCPTSMDDRIETWLAPVRKDFSFTGPKGRTNRRARAPLLFTLDPLTLKEVLISPTWACNASAGTSSPQGAGWGNMVPLGTFNALEIGDDIVGSYGGDISEVARFNKFTGARVPFSCSTGSNWSGVLALEPDGTIRNLGTANYWTVLQPVTKAQTDAAVYSVASSAAGYTITRTDATTGARTVHTLNLANVGTITDVKTSNGLLFVQSVKGMEVIISVVKGDKTPALTLPPLPVSGYVPATPIDMTLGTGEEIKPLKIAQLGTRTLDGDSYAKDPKYRFIVVFPVVDGSAWVRPIHAYMDQHGVLPTDLRLWLAPTTWKEPVTRQNMPYPIGEPIARVNVGRIGSGLVRPDFDVTAAMAAAKARGEKTIGFMLEGVAPPYYAQSKVWLIDNTVLISGSAVPPPPPVETVPKFKATFHAYDAIEVTARDGKEWASLMDRMIATPASAPPIMADPEKFSPAATYLVKAMPAGKHKFTIHGWGPSLTSDSAWLRFNDTNYPVASFPKAGGNISVVVDVPTAGDWNFSMLVREFGAAYDTILIEQQ